MKIPLAGEPSTTEVLLRWDCSCTTPRWACPDCAGEGIIDAWLTLEEAASLDKSYIVLSSERIKEAA
jgi:hypothetical protein